MGTGIVGASVVASVVVGEGASVVASVVVGEGASVVCGEGASVVASVVGASVVGACSEHRFASQYGLLLGQLLQGVPCS